MRLAVALRRVGAVVALLGTGCLLVALVLPWAHFEPNRAVPGMAGASPRDYSALRLLVTPVHLGFPPVSAVLLLYLLPLLGACLVMVEGLRAWQGSAATRAGSARLLLGIGCALFGLIDSPFPVAIPWNMLPRPLFSAGPGVRLASFGFGAVVVGGVLLAVSGGWQSAMLLAVALRHVGAVVALLGISCLLIAPVLPWVAIIQYYSVPGEFVDDMKGIIPGDYSLSPACNSCWGGVAIRRSSAHPLPASGTGIVLRGR